MNRRSILAVIALATSLLLPPAVSADGEKVLVLCNDGLAAHATAITAGITMFREYGLAYGFQVDTTTSVSAFTASNLANYSAVALLDATSNTFDESQKTAFQDFFRSGKGFIGIHSFERNFLDWTWYRDLIGISYVFDDGYANMNFYVNDTGSALSRGVPRTFVSQQQLRVDSLFFTSATPEYTVVLRSDSASNQNIPGDTINPYRQPFFPYVWTHRYDGGGPVWCALPGHLPATFSTDTAFRKLMLRGILYALNRSPESGPSAPFLASPANGWTSELTTVTLAWNSAGGATSYTVQVSNGSTFAATVAANTGAAVSAAIGGLAANADYYWRVRAANATNTGGWSAVWRFTTMDYRSWNYSRDFGLNTSPSGAAITAAQYNFPVLVRLTSANAAAVFSQAKTDGSDLRFAKTDGTVLPYQLSRYDQARQRACAWVRLDTVQANGTSQRIAMYWGKDGVASRSDSGAVFGTSYGFASVLHLNKTDRDSSNSMHLFADATGRYTARSSSTTTDTDGVFDRARYLHCSGTATANYAGDSIVISGMLGSPQQVTLSAWVRIDSIDQQNRTSGILGIASTVFLRDNGGAANDSMQVGGCFGSAFAWGSWPTSGHGLLRQGWKHVAGVVNAASSGAYVKWYMNGDSVLFFAPATQGTLTYPQNSGVNYVIGRHTGGTPSAGRKMGGSIMEARVDRVVRSSDWIRLCYRNQGPNDYLFDYSPLPRQPLLSSPADNAADRPVSLTLGWNAVPGAVVLHGAGRDRRLVRRGRGGGICRRHHDGAGRDPAPAQRRILLACQCDERGGERAVVGGLELHHGAGCARCAGPGRAVRRPGRPARLPHPLLEQRGVRGVLCRAALPGVGFLRRRGGRRHPRTPHRRSGRWTTRPRTTGAAGRSMPRVRATGRPAGALRPCPFPRRPSSSRPLTARPTSRSPRTLSWGSLEQGRGVAPIRRPCVNVLRFRRCGF